MDESIFESIKSYLGVCYNEYDTDLYMYINSAFATLAIAGSGPHSGFVLENAQQKWSDYSTDKIVLPLVKQYIQLRVKLLFDPPNNSFVTESLTQNAADVLYQINLKSDCPPADRDGIWED